MIEVLTLNRCNLIALKLHIRNREGGVVGLISLLAVIGVQHSIALGARAEARTRCHHQ